jgi:hypothetical protein
MLDPAEQRLRIIAALNAANGVELMQMAYAVTMLADFGTAIQRPSTGPPAKKRRRSPSKTR